MTSRCLVAGLVRRKKTCSHQKRPGGFGAVAHGQIQILIPEQVGDSIWSSEVEVREEWERMMGMLWRRKNRVDGSGDGWETGGGGRGGEIGC
eukprot:765217-Hanusia_phi.AAC.2